ncbi:probable apyrase 6 [Neltuma alba]|uniref:probable apyrase 6 n=1 Tax=Neltuma alba TaxID=207710 RepID=UPI0010A555A3|nr:probable apyrase 6 [Prosopis alba]
MDLQTNLQSRSSASSSSAYIPPHRTQLHPRMISLYSSPPHPNLQPNSNRQSTKWLILVASLCTVPFLFYLFTTAQKIHNSSKFAEPKSTFFGLVINARSSYSKINVFEFLGEGRIPFLDDAGSSSMKIGVGLMGFAGDPDGAGASIVQLVEFAKQQVPKKEWGRTKVQLIATHELENLSVEVREKILESCRQFLRSSGFLFKDEWARVIQGEEQGISSWVAANYALGNLGREPQETAGIVQLGGDSLQVTLALLNSKSVQPSQAIKLSGVTYNLYTQSWPELGQDAALKSLEELLNHRESKFSSRSIRNNIGNPCIPKGYSWNFMSSNVHRPIVQAAGNYSACKSETGTFLKRREDRCQRPPCKVTSSFLELSGVQISSGDFFYTSEFFGMVPRASLSELEAAGQHYCQDHWDALKIQHNEIDDLDLSKYCFSSAYMVALMHDVFGVSMEEKRIGFGNRKGTFHIDWTLGSFLVETMAEPVELEPVDPGLIVGNESVTYFSIFAFLFLIVLAAFFVLQWRKPQLKTVYDLEKGRYIVTRVPR